MLTISNSREHLPGLGRPGAARRIPLSLGLAPAAFLAMMAVPACSSSGPGAPGSGGAGVAGGTGGAAGTGGTGSGTGGRGTGGGLGTGGGAAAGGTIGTIGSGGGAGTLHGGSSALFACARGATYAAPTWGAVSQITAPNTPPANYFAFIEGPVWIGSASTLYFSDNASSPAERIFKLVPPALVPASFMESSGSNGLAVDNDDKLIVADQRNRRIVRVDPLTGVMTAVVVPPGAFKPNDVLVRGDSNIYFTDPDTGFYRVSPAGEVTGPLKQVNRPNGVALSPDENTLYVGDVGNRQVHRFTLMADGGVNTGSDQLFVTVRGDTADGMCVDCAGNLYASSSQGVEVYSPSGAPLGTVPTGESSNCTFGGPDRKTLYVTSRALLKVVPMTVPGLPD